MRNNKRHALENRSLTNQTCLVRDCASTSHCRGLCQKHYKAAQRIVQQTELTWDEIARSGLCHPRARTGRPSSSYTQRLNKLAARLHPASKPRARSRG